MTRPIDDGTAALRESLDQDGHAVLRGMLAPPLCAALAATVSTDPWSAATLPEPLQPLHAALRTVLAALAEPWKTLLGIDFPAPWAGTETSKVSRLLAGELRPLVHSSARPPLFPLQASVLLSRRDIDFQGGVLVLVEQRPRMQSKPIVVDLQAGDVAIFPARHRPVQGTRRLYRVTTRHAVTRVFSGQRVSAEFLFEP
jgi:hypothetical protein